jgi:uncharacterized protein (DUF1697 family)
MRYVALLRAVNLPKYRRISMAELRDLLTAMGYADVSTYLASGNAVFTADGTPTAQLGAQIEERLANDLGLPTEVIVRTGDELRAVVEKNPLQVRTPARFGVLFLYGPPAADWLDGLEPAEFAPEVMHAAERELYLDLPNGFGEARLPLALNRRLKVPATMRNWNTVTKLAELA